MIETETSYYRCKCDKGNIKIVKTTVTGLNNQNPKPAYSVSSVQFVIKKLT